SRPARRAGQRHTSGRSRLAACRRLQREGRTLTKVGSSNTRPGATTGTPAAVVTEAGVDTWRPVFRTSFNVDETIWRRIGQGGSYLREDVPGYKLQWFPEYGVLCAEGHPNPGG